MNTCNNRVPTGESVMAGLVKPSVRSQRSEKKQKTKVTRLCVRCRYDAIACSSEATAMQEAWTRTAEAGKVRLYIFPVLRT